jgi:hypothetical protein
MIEIELRQVPDGGHDYEPVARLAINDDGSNDTWDPQELLPFDMPVLATDDPAGPRRVTFTEAPEVWARNLRSVLRTGYLVPVITKDTTATP